MTKTDFLQLIAEIVGVPPGSLTGKQRLEEFENWDSLAIIAFIALVDKHFSVRIPGREITQCATVSDLVGLLGDRVTS